MTFRERFHRSSSWHEKVIVIELFHLRQVQNDSRWNLSKTAQYFSISAGLVSENLKLAKAIHDEPEIVNCKNRKLAMVYLGHKALRDIQKKDAEDAINLETPE